MNVPPFDLTNRHVGRKTVLSPPVSYEPKIDSAIVKLNNIGKMVKNHLLDARSQLLTVPYPGTNHIIVFEDVRQFSGIGTYLS